MDLKSKFYYKIAAKIEDTLWQLQNTLVAYATQALHFVSLLPLDTEIYHSVPLGYFQL